MDRKTLAEVFAAISGAMDENKEYLIELDQQNGDGDLGISMSSGFRRSMFWRRRADLGKLFMKCGSVFNEAASSLGTISPWA